MYWLRKSHMGGHEPIDCHKAARESTENRGNRREALTGFLRFICGGADMLLPNVLFCRAWNNCPIETVSMMR